MDGSSCPPGLGPHLRESPEAFLCSSSGPVLVPGAVSASSLLHGPLPALPVLSDFAAHGPEASLGSELSGLERLPQPFPSCRPFWPVPPVFTLRSWLCVLSSTLAVTGGWLVWPSHGCLLGKKPRRFNRTAVCPFALHPSSEYLLGLGGPSWPPWGGKACPLECVTDLNTEISR